jgi:alanine racemase
MDTQTIQLQDDPDRAAIGAAGGLLTIDLDAIRANYRILSGRLGPATHCGCVVKADGYGMGAARIAGMLLDEGCRWFFVAHLNEALVLRAVLPPDARVVVLHGPTPGAEPGFADGGILPVLNSPEQVAAWSALAQARGTALPALLQFDTGMSRFGLPEDFVPDLAGIDVLVVMSHLACADTPEHPANAMQLAAFRRIVQRFPGIPASLAATSGIFLGSDYHFDIVRAGAGLYVVNPQTGRPNPLQVREVPANTPVGYGHTRITTRPSRLATVAVGYADGFLRSTGPQGAAWAGDTKLPVMGRVSMDSIIFDATDSAVKVGDLVDLIGTHHDLDAAATAAGTIGYEILTTSLGARYARRYIGG